MSYSIYLEQEFGELRSSNWTFHLVDKLIRTPRERIDVTLVQIDKRLFPVDFVVLNMDLSYGSQQIPLILGHRFPATVNATINFTSGVMDVSVMNMRVNV